MHAFRPTRSSTPPRARNAPTTSAAESLLQSTLSAEGSASLSAPEFAGLSAEDIEIIDAIVERAGPTASTFLTAFKAYSDVLNEQGMDTHEVLYYGKLLKLGTLRGGSWKDKWLMIKRQYGYDDRPPSPAARPRPPPERGHDPPDSRVKTRRPLSVDAHRPLTRYARQQDTFSVDSETQDYIDESLAHPPPNALGLSFEDHPLLRTPPKKSRLLPGRSNWPQSLESEADDSIDHLTPPSTTLPPSYKAALRAPVPQRPSSFPAKKVDIPTRSKTVDPPPKAPLTPVSDFSKQPRQRRNSAIDEQDAWNKVKMLRDEREADQFRNDMLLERCWRVWREGFHWIVTTHEQISAARDNLILRVSLQRWRAKMAARCKYYDQVGAVADKFRVRSALAKWRKRTKAHQQAAWRHDMRLKMKAVRDRHDLSVKTEAWEIWKRAHRSQVADEHHARQLASRVLRIWQRKLARVDEMASIADQHQRNCLLRRVDQCWEQWTAVAQLHIIERSIRERVDLRIMDSAMEKWKKETRNTFTAEAFRNFWILKKAIRSWKAARDRIQFLNARADKHVARQDDLLLRAVLKVWKAHESGRLLERVKRLRLLKQAWRAWKGCIKDNQTRQDLAVVFSKRSRAACVNSAMETWTRVFVSHQKSYTFALDYNSSRLASAMVVQWKNCLRQHARMKRNAILIDKYLVMRHCWRAMRIRFVERKRMRLLELFERNKRRQYFEEWAAKAARTRQIKLAEAAVQRRVMMRLMKLSLAHWTNRVIDVKLREWEVAQKYEVTLLATALKKWQRACQRHIEELDLMQSYQDVKREENIRRMFYRWLSAARSARRRRLILQAKEDEMKFSAIAVAWDKWRERFKDERLRPLERTYLMQRQKGIVYQAFGVWCTKTKSLPAIQFYASNLKGKSWQVWRNAMPRALQAKKAREVDRKNVLRAVFAKWNQSYRSKVALKAVARARYLRLPSPTPRRQIKLPEASMQCSSPSAASSGPFSRRRMPQAKESGVREDDIETPRPRPLTGISRWNNAGGSRSRAGSSPPPRTKPDLPATRDSSPARSTKSSLTNWRTRDVVSQRKPGATNSEDGHGRLWMELQEIRRKSRPPSSQSMHRYDSP